MHRNELEDLLRPSDTFVRRHVGPDETEVAVMLDALGLPSLEALVDETVPGAIRFRGALSGLGSGRGEHELLEELRAVASRNLVFRSYIGLGYSDCITPPVIQRNILENPGWYTQYTPYQAEISQGRLEALVNYQTMVADLTALPLANASLLDEATAAAEAMTMAWGVAKHERHTFFVAADCHPQTIAVVQTRAKPLGIRVVVGPASGAADAGPDLFGALVQYPATDGAVRDYTALAQAVHDAGALFVMATDLLALTLLTPPGEVGADIAVGSAQRFGVPMGFGGPHAAFMATRDEHKRHMPGRIIGASKDAAGRPAYRMALQTREQHIRREKATSNICTAQVLLAIMAGMYAVWHGPDGLRRIAERVHGLTSLLAAGLRHLGLDVGHEAFFDTLTVKLGAPRAEEIHMRAFSRRLNLRAIDASTVGISLDETTSGHDVEALLSLFTDDLAPSLESLAEDLEIEYPEDLHRASEYLTHPVFRQYHAEHEMLRYIRRLEARDLSLTTSMIPLGSCTMKLNATSEMLPISWPQFARMHPFAPEEQTRGYRDLIADLERWLADITGFAAVSLQPNAGSQGEYTGLLVIRAWHESHGQGHRDVCLIPVSAHGTNPASAVMAGLRVVVVACDEAGNIDLGDLAAKATQHRDQLAAVMITYPSTHGVFEAGIREACAIVHAHGGQVYLDGANMNAQVGLSRPGDYGADVCHLNLHKTFCIPHGGGGPGMGPIAVAPHLAPFLPGHPLVKCGGSEAIGAVSAAPYGSALILTIPWVYIALMGGAGLERATQVAILNANYIAARLRDHYPVLYTGPNGRVAHELILDFRPFKAAGIGVEDVAKRLMDYGFHAPTMSFPVAGTMMIEPTESESKAELDRLCDALIDIREEIRAVEDGLADRADNVLVNAPHTAAALTADTWTHPYTRDEAAFPAPWTRVHKFWPPVARIDNAYGDRNLVCTCLPIETYAAT